MFTFGARHSRTGGISVAGSHASAIPAGGSSFYPSRSTYGIPVTYTVDEGNGTDPYEVDAAFPGTYSGLDYVPEWDGAHLFLGWKEASPDDPSAVAYDSPVEYVESSGDCLVDTGLSADRRLSYDIGLAIMKSGINACGVYKSQNVRMACGRYTALRNGVILGGTSNIVTGDYASATEFRYVQDMVSSAIAIDDTSARFEDVGITESVLSQFVDCDTFTLFALRNYSNPYIRYASMRVYHAKFSQDGSPVLDLTPVRAGPVGFLFDRRSGAMYGAASGAVLSAGPDTGGGWEVSPDDEIVLEDRTFRAVWMDAADVEFDAGAGTMPQWGRSYFAGRPYGELPEPVPPAGKLFMGWSANGFPVDADSVVVPGTRLVAGYITEPVYDTSYECVATSTYPKTGIYSATRHDSSEPVVVDWGDGSIDIVYGNLDRLVHEYQTAGTYTVRISNLSTFMPSYADTSWYQTDSNSQYTFKRVLALSPHIANLSAYAFYNCAAMTDAVIPSGATIIPAYCFYFCQNLKNVVLPSTVTTIDAYAFYYCYSSNFNTITIPAATTLVGNYAFSYCYYLHPVFEASSSELTLRIYAFDHCGYNGSAYVMDLSPRKVTSIPGYCFRYCRYMKEFKWPSGVTSIGAGAFRYCFYYATSTGTLAVPEGVESVGGAYAFANCLYLTAITLPSTLTTLDNYTFYYCPRLATMTCNRSAAPAASQNSFGNSATYYTGRNAYSAGTNRLVVPAGATGYDTGYWLDPLQDSTKCGFTLVNA